MVNGIFNSCLELTACKLASPAQPASWHHLEFMRGVRHGWRVCYWGPQHFKTTGSEQDLILDCAYCTASSIAAVLCCLSTKQRRPPCPGPVVHQAETWCTTHHLCPMQWGNEGGGSSTCVLAPATGQCDFKPGNQVQHSMLSCVKLAVKQPVQWLWCTDGKGL